MITVELDSRAVLAALEALRDKAVNLGPAMREIGERLTETTQARFGASTGPDGQRWAPNSQATILDYLAGKSGSYGKTGKLTKKGAGSAMSKRPLVASGLLQGSIHWQLIDGGQGVAVGTDRFADAWEGGAAVHQFGSRDGKIPARPFLGISGEDERTILDILARHLGRQ